MELLIIVLTSVLITFLVGVVYGFSKHQTLLKLYKSKYELLNYAVNNPVKNETETSG